MLMLVLLVGMIALSGVRLRWLAGSGAAAGWPRWPLVTCTCSSPTRCSRLTAFANPSADPRGTGYSAAQAKIAIGSGGMFGQGLFHGQLVAGNFVPEQHTDFIFAVAGEELGFVGCVADHRAAGHRAAAALRIAARADDMFGMLVASGIAIWFARAVVHQHRHDHRDHAGDRPAAAVRLLRRVGHVRRHDRRRPAPGRPPAPHGLQLAPRDRALAGGPSGTTDAVR